MQWHDPLHGLEFQDHPLLDDDVGDVPAIQGGAAIENRQRNLAFKRELCLGKLMAQACMVNLFEQARPKMLVHLDG